MRVFAFFVCVHHRGTSSPTPWQDAWRELEKLYAEGATRAIGVSNFSEGLLRELLEFATVMPAAVQNWMDPFHQDKAVRALCAVNGERAHTWTGYSVQRANPFGIFPPTFWKKTT